MSTTKGNPMVEAMNRKKAKVQDAGSGGVARTFREVTESMPMKKTTFDLPVDIHKALRWEAMRRDVSMRDLVLGYIEAGMSADGIDLKAE